MKSKATCLPAFLLIVLMQFSSCESQFYPPTDPPTLSNIILTSDTYHDATSTVREGDTVFVSVDVSDPEGDPETLNLSVLSGDSEVVNSEISSSRIFNSKTWETWFDSAGLTTGSYSIRLSAVDRKGNESDTLSRDFTITADDRMTLDLAGGDINIFGDGYILKDADPDINPYDPAPATGEPFRITFSIKNNSSLKIDLLEIPFTVNMNWDDDDNPGTPDVIDTYNPIAIVSGLEAGETRDCICNAYIQNTRRSFNSIAYTEANCSATIY